MKPIHFFNGQFLHKEEIVFSVDDVGILRGYGVFDYFKAYKAVPVFMKEHLDRFESSANLMGIKIPYSRPVIEKAIQRILVQNNQSVSGIKLLLTGGNSPDGFSAGKPNLAILNNPASETDAVHYQNGASLMTYQFFRDFPSAKTTNYGAAVMLEPLWKKDGHIDVLYHDGFWVTEVSRSNIFLISENRLITNEFGVLPGITRSKVIEVARAAGFEIEIRPVSLEEVQFSTQMFITSTNKKVMPIVKLDQRSIGTGAVGESTKRIMAAFDSFVKVATQQSPFQD
ncbi:MAG: D-alanine transaminase/branched-chain amino acid aminotransferase [Roseivirga sp.]|jgi:branched-chain amino acid aminotransferase